MAAKSKAAGRKRKARGVRAPNLGRDIAFLLCGASEHGGHESLNDGDYSIQLFGNSKGFKKLGTYFLALAEHTTDDCGFHQHFFQIRSLSKTRLKLTVRRNKTADVKGML
jgi:hypothetical protein